MADQRSGIVFAFKTLLFVMLLLLVVFTLLATISGHWAAATTGWFGVVMIGSVTDLGARLMSPVANRLSRAQTIALGTVPLSLVWLRRFFATGDLSPAFALAIAVLAIWSLLTVVSHGWRRTSDS